MLQRAGENKLREATRHRTMDELGVMPRPATMEDTLAAGEEIAAAHIENWADVREAVFEEMQQRPQWLHAVQGNPDAARSGRRSFPSLR